MQNAIYRIFEIDIKGCWFHFNQAIIRKLFNLGKYVNLIKNQIT